MANPVLVTCTENTFIKVAENVQVGKIDIMKFFDETAKKKITYFRTYRLTGQSAPTDSNKNELVSIKGEYIGISHSSAVDVYLYCVGGTGEVGVST